MGKIYQGWQRTPQPPISWRYPLCYLHSSGSDKNKLKSLGDVFNFINLIYSETCFMKQQEPYRFNFNDSTYDFSKNTETGLSDCHKLSTTFCKALSCRILFKYLWLKLAWVTIMNWFQHFVKLFHVRFFSKILTAETGLSDYHKLSSTFCKALLCRIVFKNTCDWNWLAWLS